VTFDEGAIRNLNGVKMPDDVPQLPVELPIVSESAGLGSHHHDDNTQLPSTTSLPFGYAPHCDSESDYDESDVSSGPPAAVTPGPVPAPVVMPEPVAIDYSKIPVPPPPLSPEPGSPVPVQFPDIDEIGVNQYIHQDHAAVPDAQYAHDHDTRNRRALFTDAGTVLPVAEKLQRFDDELLASYAEVTNTEYCNFTDLDILRLHLCQSLHDTHELNPNTIDAMTLSLDMNEVYPVGDDLAPKSFREAVALDNHDRLFWIQAIKSEYHSHISRGTWRAIHRNGDMCLLEPKWIFTIKRNPDGTIARYKARLVVRGFRQIRHMHYDPNDLYSPVLRNPTLRVMLAVAAEFGLDLRQLDIVTAFLYGVLPEDSKLFMSIPEGYASYCDPTMTLPSSECALKLVKAIYGLKQAPKVWSDTIKDFLVKLGFRVSDGDPCLFVKRVGDEFTQVGVFVDDLLIGFKRIRDSNILEEQLCKAFQMKVMGPASWFLGMHIRRDPVTKQVSLTHELYIGKLVATYCPNNTEVRTTPCLERTRYTSDQCPKTDADKKLMATKPYGRLLGALLYLAMTCRPDIVWITTILARFGKNPGEAHWNGLMDIVIYLATYPNLGLTYSPTNHASGKWLMPIAFSDADWANPKGYGLAVASEHGR
jgi:hypothetical protein